MRTATRRARARPPPRDPATTGRRPRAPAGSRAPRGWSSSAARARRPGRRAGRPRAGRAGRTGRRAGCRSARARRGSAAATRWCTARRPVDDVGVVGGRHDRTARGPVGGDEPDDGRPGAAVLPDRGLVGEQHRRAVVQRGRDGEAALLTAGELARVGRLEVAQPERREQRAGAVGGCRVVTGRRPRLPRRGRSPHAPGGDEHLVEHGAGDDRRARPLRHPRERAGELGGGQRRRATRHPTTLAPPAPPSRSVVGRNPARACSAVDLPDPLGPTSAVSEPGTASRGWSTHRGATGAGGAVDQPRGALDDERCGREGCRVRAPCAAPPGPGRPASGRAARRRAPRCPSRGAGRARSTGWRAPGRRRPPGRRRRARPAGRRGRPTVRARARRRRAWGRQGCAEGWPGARSGVRDGHLATSRARSGRPRPRAPPAPSRRRASPSARRAARPTGRGPASPRGPAAGSAHPTAPTSGCPAAGPPARPPAARTATTPAMSPRGIRTFSGPKATSRPTDAATTPAPGSCSTSPTAPGRVPGRDTVDGHRAGELAGIHRLEQAREGAQQRGLPGARGADEQHPLPRSQGERDVAQHRLAPPEGAPGERRRPRPAHAREAVDGVGGRRRRRQTACCSRCSWPAGNADSAPARARARTSSQPSSPASTAPETAIAPR